jgi:hypothetical protein
MKASAAYSNSEWDLVDAAKNGKVKLAPDAAAQVAEKSEERSRIATRINDLAARREVWLAGGGEAPSGASTTPVVTATATPPPAAAPPTAVASQPSLPSMPAHAHRTAAKPAKAGISTMKDAFDNTIRDQARAHGYGF